MNMNFHYNAIVSSDWSECLAPCGPFDCLSYNYPELKPRLTQVFKQYTGNRISLGQASEQIRTALPGPVTEDQMDAYLDASFVTYTGVADLIEWCSRNHVLFMINTTGMIGYFQRVFVKGLLPVVPVISAHPMIRFPKQASDPQTIFDLFETQDKGKNTSALAASLGMSSDKNILMGDSGGDGPHFEWGAESGAFLIGSMTKPSLAGYCRSKDIAINLKFGIDYSSGHKPNLQKELQHNFMDLVSVISEIAKR